MLINRRGVEAVAQRYRNRGVPLNALVQVAYEGLTKAVAHFDPTMRKDLLTYAVPTIRGELRRYFRDRGWMVRPPRWIQELQARALQTRGPPHPTADRQAHRGDADAGLSPALPDRGRPAP
ncbi:MAG: sigma-70 family RNA polymerase sigma factor [Nocardioides sp.]